MAAAAVSLPAELESALRGVDEALDRAEEALQPFTNPKTLAAVSKKLSPLDNARLNATVGFVATSLVYAHLRVSGMDLKNHAIQGEIARTREGFKKIEDAEKMEKARAGEKISNLDAAAAGRMITASISAANFASSAVAGMKRARPKDEEEDGKDKDSNKKKGKEAEKRRKTESKGDDSDSDSNSSTGSSDDSSSSSEEEKGERRNKKRDERAGASFHGGNGGKKRDDRGKKHHDRSSSGSGGGGERGGGGGGGGGKGGVKPVIKKRDSIKAAPQPTLSHLNWQKEMQAKFG